MISLLVSVVLLFNVESSFDDKKQTSSIKKTVQIIKTIHGVKWGVKLKYLIIFLFIMVLGCENIKQSIGIELKLYGFSFYSYPTAITYEYHIPILDPWNNRGQQYLKVLFDFK